MGCNARRMDAMKCPSRNAPHVMEEASPSYNKARYSVSYRYYKRNINLCLRIGSLGSSSMRGTQVLN